MDARSYKHVFRTGESPELDFSVNDVGCKGGATEQRGGWHLPGDAGPADYRAWGRVKPGTPPPYAHVILVDVLHPNLVDFMPTYKR